MFTNIMVPVDLRHPKQMERSLKVAADLARLYGATVTYAAVAAATPGALAHNPAEFAAKLADFAGEEADTHGIKTATRPIISHDPTADLDDHLLEAASEVSADLVIMATHMPNITDYIWPSHGGRLAAHAVCSVLLVRG